MKNPQIPGKEMPIEQALFLYALVGIKATKLK